MFESSERVANESLSCPRCAVPFLGIGELGDGLGRHQLKGRQ